MRGAPEKNMSKTSNGDYNMNSANSTTGNNGGGFQNSSTHYSSSHRGGGVGNNSGGGNMVKVKSDVFNNIYKVRHLLDEIGMFMNDLNGENSGLDLNGYLESMRTCQVIVEELIETSEPCDKNSDKEETNIMHRMNGL